MPVFVYERKSFQRKIIMKIIFIETLLLLTTATFFDIIQKKITQKIIAYEETYL